MYTLQKLKGQENMWLVYVQMTRIRTTPSDTKLKNQFDLIHYLRKELTLTRDHNILHYNFANKLFKCGDSNWLYLVNFFLT